MTIRPVRQRDGARLMAADESSGLRYVIRIFADPPVGPPEVLPPRGAENDACLLGFEQPLLRRPVAAHLSGSQVAEPDAHPQLDVFRDRAAEANFEVVWM